MEAVTLAGEREWLLSFLHMSIQAAGWMDMNGDWLAVNSRLCELTGYTEQEWLAPMVGGPVLFTIGERAVSPLECAAESPEPKQIRMYHKKGYSDLELHGNALVMTGGIQTGYLIQFREMVNYPDPAQERKRERERELEHQTMLEQALRLSKQHYKSLFDQHPDAVFSLDQHGRVLTLNSSFERITGFTAGELFQTNFINRTSSEDWAATYDMFQQALRGLPQVFNTRVRHKDGRWIEFRLYLLPILVELEPKGVYGIAQDITEEKRLIERLRVSEEMYRLIEENSFDLILRCALDGRLLYVSPIAHKLIGYEPHELIQDYTQHYVHPDDMAIVNAKLNSQLKMGKEPTLFSCRFRHKEGHYVWMESMVSVVRDNPDGSGSSFLCVSRDISERKQTEELMLRSEKLLMAGQLAAGIAHEIRNPLTSIKGFLQLLGSQLKDKQEFMTIMRSELNRIEEITNELLLLAKPHAQAFRDQEINGLLKQVASIMEPQSLLTNVQVVCEFADTPLYVRCDENQLKQVFINFMKNAIEAMPGGGTLKVAVERQNGEAVISIQDQGCGIPEEQLATIWQPFFTTKERGTGLGLMVSYSIIENHKGRVQVASVLGAGTTFSVYLPLLSLE